MPEWARSGKLLARLRDPGNLVDRPRHDGACHQRYVHVYDVPYGTRTALREDSKCSEAVGVVWRVGANEGERPTMRVVSRRRQRVPWKAVWITGALILVTCLTVRQSSGPSTAQQGGGVDAPVALAAALEHAEGGSSGPSKNLVDAVGTHDFRLTFRGHAQMNAFEGTSANAKNVAIAVGSCYQCVNFAVALQMIFVTPKVGDVTNAAKSVAVNVECARCTTVAISIVYVIVTPNIEKAESQVRGAIERINDQFDSMSGWSTRSLATVASRISAAIQQFANAAITVVLGLLPGVKGAAPASAAPRGGVGASGAVMAGGAQVVPALPGTPEVDIKQG